MPFTRREIYNMPFDYMMFSADAAWAYVLASGRGGLYLHGRARGTVLCKEGEPGGMVQ